MRGVGVGVSTPAIQSSGTRCAYKLGLLCKIYFNSCFSLADDKTGYPIVFVVRVIMSVLLATICTSTNGGTSAVSLVTRFFKAERRLIRRCLHDPLRRLTIGLGDREENNTKKIVHHKKLHPTQNQTQP